MKLKKQRKGFADRAFDRKARASRPKPNWQGEYLVGCYVERQGMVFGDLATAYRTHSDVRRKIGDANPYEETPGDICGYITSEGRMVGRREGSTIAVLAGQAAPMYDGTDILSCDIAWRPAL